MNKVIAQTHLYKNINGAKLLAIKIYEPKPDPILNGDYRCGVKFTGRKLKYIHGIDSFQALNLAMYYVKIELRQIEKYESILYLDKKLKCKHSIKKFVL